MPNDSERQPQHETDSLSDEELEQVGGGIVGDCIPDFPFLETPGPQAPDVTSSGSIPS